jgi:hypothetical protein
MRTPGTSAVAEPIHRSRPARSDRRGGTVVDSITITDNRTGETIEIPLVDGTVSAKGMPRFTVGAMSYSIRLATRANISQGIFTSSLG